MLRTSDRWNAFRRQMPVAEHWAYFDHAAVAPLSKPAQAALIEWANDLAAHGDVHWDRWRKRVERVRTLAAQLLGAQKNEIALVRNTTEGIHLVAEGFPWQPGDNVVFPAAEFPSNRYPWMNLRTRGVEFREVPTRDERVDLDELDAACDGRTRIVAASWVGYATGWRNDLEAMADIAHRHGALLFIDAIQGLGVLPLDVSRTQVDFLAADGHKWLLGPEGAGILFVRHEHLERLRPLGIGWNSVTDAGEFASTGLSLKPSAARYEGGSYNMAGVHALGASLELFAEYGTEAITSRLFDATEEICRRLHSIGAEVVSARDADRWSGIIAFTLPGQDPAAVRQACLERQVVVNCRAGRVRISPHIYLDETDIGRLVEAVASLR